VAVITILLHNLALAVLIGVISLGFAWESAKRIRAKKYVDADGVKHYSKYMDHCFLHLQLRLQKNLMS
jgi:SulP family sulfate permease